MDNLHFIPDNILTKLFKKLTKYKNDYQQRRVTICSSSPKDLGYEPNEPNTINLQRVGKRAGLLANGTTANKDFKYEQT